MQWAYCGIWQTREDTVRLNLVRVRGLDGLGALGRLDLKGLLLFVYPNFILWWVILPLGKRRRGFSSSSSASSLITCASIIFVFASL